MGQNLPDRYYKLEKNIKIGYLDQIPNYADNEKVYTCLKSVFGELNIISEQLKLLEEKMSMDVNDIDELMLRYGNLQSYYEEHGGYEIDAKIRRVASGLNITHLLESQWKDLSGGERTKVGIAQILIKPTDLLLLDEPTNHLDFKSIEWLTNYIKIITALQ